MWSDGRDVALGREGAASAPVADFIRRRGWREGEPSTGQVDDAPDVILLGCVSLKQRHRARAKDLYTSPLFLGRRAHAESSGKPWYIFSAKHGLLAPDDEIDWYDVLLDERPAAQRAALGRKVVSDLQARLGSLDGLLVEIHAGKAYVGAVAEPLARAGARLSTPLAHLSIGRQLQWYARPGTGAIADDSSPRVVSRHRERPFAAGAGGRGLARRITESFMNGDLDLRRRPGAPQPGWAGMPEFVGAARLRAAGASDVEVRLWLTFTVAMDRMRDADDLARASADLWSGDPWVFDPDQVVRRDPTEVFELLRVSRVTKLHSEDGPAWLRIAASLDGRRSIPIWRAIADGTGDAPTLLRELAGRDRSGPFFPLLRGPKIGRLWIRELAYPGSADLRDLAAIEVAVDVQVRKVTEYLGVTETAGGELSTVRGTIQRAWQDDVAVHGAAGPASIENTSATLDPALWFFAKWGCTFCEENRLKAPISDICRECRFPARGANG